MTQSNTNDRTAVLDPEEVKEVSAALDVVGSVVRGEVDMQVATARRWPRSVKAFLHAAKEMATLDEETAASCFYALPRDGKTVEGPSARLAEICASAWGHMRIQSRIISEDERFITARGEAWDVQTNVAIGYEVRRRITGRNGRKYSDDMVTVTANAASSIALRNAVFKVIPSAFWRPLFLECKRVAVGDVQTLVSRRDKMLAHFQQLGVRREQVFEQLGIGGVEDITLDHLATLRGLATALRDGDTTVEEAFPSKVQPKTGAAEPEGFAAFTDLMRVAAMQGAEALQAALAAGTLEQREYLTKHQNATWESLKAAAMQADTVKKGADAAQS